MLDARPFALAEDPLLRSATDRVAAQLGIASAEALPDRRRLSAGLRRRARARGRDARRLDRPAPGRPPRRARGRHRPRARARAEPRRPHPDVRRAARDDARRDEQDRRLPLARAALRPRPRSRPRSRTRCCRRGASIAADRDAAAVCNPHDLADALLRLDQRRRARLVRGVARRPSRSTPSIRSSATGSRGCSAPIRRSPSACGACGRSERRRTRGRRRTTSTQRPSLTPDAGAVGPERREGDTLSCVPFLELIRRRPTLPGALAPSTIGAGGLNFSVRNGKRCTPAAMTAESVKGGTRPPARRAREPGVGRSSAARTFKTP